jgi:hypothetical protein
MIHNSAGSLVYHYFSIFHKNTDILVSNINTLRLDLDNILSIYLDRTVDEIQNAAKTMSDNLNVYIANSYFRIGLVKIGIEFLYDKGMTTAFKKAIENIRKRIIKRALDNRFSSIVDGSRTDPDEMDFNYEDIMYIREDILTIYPELQILLDIGYHIGSPSVEILKKIFFDPSNDACTIYVYPFLPDFVNWVSKASTDDRKRLFDTTIMFLLTQGAIISKAITKANIH